MRFYYVEFNSQLKQEVELADSFSISFIIILSLIGRSVAQEISRSPPKNFILQFLHIHLIHFIRPCDDALGAVGRNHCYFQTFNKEASLHLIPRPALCRTRVEDIYLVSFVNKGWYHEMEQLYRVSKKYGTMLLTLLL